MMIPEAAEKYQDNRDNGRFSELTFVASATNYTKMDLHLVLEHKPFLIFLEIDPEDASRQVVSLVEFNELAHYIYLKVMPKVIVTTAKKGFGV
jgi:two-component system LytT family response regulator